MCLPSKAAAHSAMKKLKRLRCYVRPYRLRWGLSQEEVAFIIGIKSRKLLSYLENHKVAPTLAMAVALRVVFGTEHAELFPTITKIEKDVLARANDLYERLQGDPSKRTKMKLDFFEFIFERAQRSGNGAIQV
jgi:transcriptional regulator with XRE-family HTH domain